MTALFAAVCILAGVAAAVTESTGRSVVGGILKMLAATAYIGFALSLGAAASPYGRLVLVALALSWAGDLLLLGTGRLFLAGLGAFLLAHVAYAAAFLTRGVDVVPTAVGAGVMVVVAVSTLRWLVRAQLPEKYRGPITAYLVAIGVMVALALGTAWPDMAAGIGVATGRALVLGAGAFAVSDLFVARHRFVRREPRNRLIGLPLYFVAQLLLASSV